MVKQSPIRKFLGIPNPLLAALTIVGLMFSLGGVWATQSQKIGVLQEKYNDLKKESATKQDVTSLRELIDFRFDSLEKLLKTK